jgi:hypothetical protein
VGVERLVRADEKGARAARRIDDAPLSVLPVSGSTPKRAATISTRSRTRTSMVRSTIRPVNAGGV